MGKKVALDSIDEVKSLNLKEEESLSMAGLGVIYVPNMRPNKIWPGSALGVSDYCNTVSLMDALDEAWTSWMRDLRLGAAKVLIDKELLEPTTNDAGQTNTWSQPGMNHFKEVFLKLELGAMRIGGQGEKYDPIKEVQFDIRWEAHQATCMALFESIIGRAGYNPQTFGMHIEGQAESGTALRIRERKSMMTRQKKGRYWSAAIRSLLAQLQMFDAASGLSSKTEEVEVKVELQDSVIPDPVESSEVIRNLAQAEALSVRAKVMMAHPEWGEDKVEEEIAAIEEEKVADTPPSLFEQPEGGEEVDEGVEE